MMADRLARFRVFSLAVGVAATALVGCDSPLFSKVVDVEAGGPPPRQVFASLSTADSVWRVWVTEGLRSDEDGPADVVEEAQVYLTVGDNEFGPFELATESVYIGFPFDQTNEFDVFMPQRVFAYPVTQPLQPGESFELRVEFIDGNVIHWERTIPDDPQGTLTKYTTSIRDTTFREGGFSTAVTSPTVTYAIERRRGAAVRYYRVQAAYGYYVSDVKVLTTYGSAFPIYDNDADRERAFARYVASDEGVKGDTLVQAFTLGGYSLLRINNLLEDEGIGQIDSISANVVLEAIDEPSARFYADLEEARRAESNFFAEPIVLGSQVEGAIGHVVVASVAEAIAVEVY